MREIRVTKFCLRIKEPFLKNGTSGRALGNNAIHLLFIFPCSQVSGNDIHEPTAPDNEVESDHAQPCSTTGPGMYGLLSTRLCKRVCTQFIRH